MQTDRYPVYRFAISNEGVTNFVHNKASFRLDSKI